MIFASKILNGLDKGGELESFDFCELAEIEDKEELREALMDLIENGDGGITFFEPKIQKWKRISFVKDDEFKKEIAKNFVENFVKAYFEVMRRNQVETLEEKKVLIQQILVAAYESIEDDVKINYIG